MEDGRQAPPSMNCSVSDSWPAAMVKISKYWIFFEAGVGLHWLKVRSFPTLWILKILRNGDIEWVSANSKASDFAYHFHPK